MPENFNILDGQLVIHCPEKIDSDFGAATTKLLEEKIESIEGVVLDFQRVETDDLRPLFRFIGALGKYLRASSKPLLGINASGELASEIRKNGLDSAIRITTNPKADVRPKRKWTLNVDFLNPFIDSTIKTLQTQCNIELRIEEKPFLKGSRELPPIDIAGIIGLTSQKFSGSVSICFPKATFLGVMEGMLGEAYPEITKDLEDGAGELLNIIFGQSKVVLNEKGFGIEKALPTIVTGQSLKLRSHGQSPALILMFSSMCGPFYIEVALDDPA